MGLCFGFLAKHKPAATYDVLKMFESCPTKIPIVTQISGRFFGSFSGVSCRMEWQ
jgi:hypothetical protein